MKEGETVNKASWDRIRFALEDHPDPIRAVKIAIAAITNDAIDQDEKKRLPKIKSPRDVQRGHLRLVK